MLRNIVLPMFLHRNLPFCTFPPKSQKCYKPNGFFANSVILGVPVNFQVRPASPKTRGGFAPDCSVCMGTIRVMFMYLCSIIYVQLISPILGKHKYAWEPLELCLCIYVQLIIPSVFELIFQKNSGASRA